MKKLLNRTLLYYALSAFFLLLISAPVYYWFSEKLYIEDVDEAILLRKEEFFKNSLQTLKQSDIPTWNRFNRDTYIIPDTVTQVKGTIIQQTFYDTLDNEWEPYRVLYSNIKIENNNYILMKRLNLVESEDLVRTTGMLYFIILIVLLSGFIIVSKVVSSRLWKPFYQSLSLIEQFNIEKLSVPEFTDTRTKEFQQLNKALQNLIGQNIKAFQAQKEFTENAAHELQTPLAVFQSKLDLLLQDNSLTQQQATIIQQLYEAVSKLSRLNKNLLLLAKIENNQFTEKEPISIASLVKEVLPYFSEQAEEKQLHIQSDLQQEIKINAITGLTEILINNLLLNAISHNVDNGTIHIQIHDNTLSVSNTGSQESLQPGKLFSRFSKGSANPQSNGLGLAIVKKIADINNWKVEYSFQDGSHTFSVKF